jgi:DNA invertase Pin-like site-specific DNA recombinase
MSTRTITTGSLTDPVAYSYIRFSTPEQAKGDSLRRQTKDTEDWCRRHGARLDTSTTLHDLGASAFAKKRRRADEDAMAGFIEADDLVNPDRKALAGFLALIKQRKVPRGSYLVVEYLDRLTRDDLVPAVHLLTGILLAGVRVVQLHPVEQVLTQKSEGYQIMLAVVELMRGHSESAAKSGRMREAWEGKRELARAGQCQKPTKRMGSDAYFLTHLLPAWCELRGGKIVKVPERAAIVHRMFQLAAAGYGRGLIARKLTADKLPPFSTAKVVKKGTERERMVGGKWNASTVGALLRDRRVLGEYQPRTREGKMAGDPIPGYFPEVVKEEDFLAAGAAISARRGRPGRADCTIGLFGGLVTNARDGEAYYISARPPSGGRGKAQRVLIAASNRERGDPARTYPEETFEKAILSCLREIDPGDLLPKDDGPDESLVLSARLEQVRASIAALNADMDEHGESPALMKRVRDKEAEEQELEEKLRAARQTAAVPLPDAWEDCHTLLDALAAAPDPMDARLRLRTLLRRIVAEIVLLVHPRGKDRLAAVQMHFQGGGIREYLIWHHPPRGNRICVVPGWWRVASVRSIGLHHPESPVVLGLVGFDLRDPVGRGRVEDTLNMDDEHLEWLFSFGCPKQPIGDPEKRMP